MATFFVSSTFRDMHDERDCMHKEIIPILMNEAFEYGDTIAIRDLRWGVNTTDEKSVHEADQKVLTVCLREIDLCRPYIIVILGNRYGYVPGSQVIEKALKGIKTKFILSEKNKDISVTELEIRYGALWNKEQDIRPKILFYMRNFEGSDIPPEFQTEDECGKQKLSELKNSIEGMINDEKNNKNIIVRHYPVKWNPKERTLDGLEDFSRWMIEDIRQLMQEEWQSSLVMTVFQKEKRHHWEYARAKADQFTGRKEIVDSIFERLDGGQRLIVLQGENGSGKSALMSHLSIELEKRNRKTKVLTLFCGYTPLTCRGLDIIRRMVEFIEEILGIKIADDRRLRDDTDWKEWKACLEERIEYFLEKKRNGEKLVILVDAVDQMDKDVIRDYLLFIPKNLSGRVQMIISCLKEYPLSLNETDVISIEPLTENDEKENIIREMFFKEGKEVYKGVLEKILKKPKADNPLYLSLLVQRLFMMEKRDFQNVESINASDYNKSMESYQTEILEICPNELNKMCVSILDEASIRTEWELAKNVIQYLAASRYGLRETDLEQIFLLEGQPWSSLNFFRFYGYMRGLFIIRGDARYDFSHRSIREGYKEWVIKENGGAEQFVQVHKRILKHLSDNLKEYDPIRMNEIVYHCYHGDEKEYLLQYLCSIQEKNQDDERRKSILEAAARGVHELCASEEGRKWIYSTLEMCNPWKKPKETENILNFVYLFGGPMFESSVSELETQNNIYTICLKLSEKLDKELESRKSRQLLADSCYYLGNVCHRLGGIGNYSRALNLYLREKNIADSMYEGENSAEVSRRQMNSLYHLGNIYATMNGRENQNLALRLYMKNKVLSEMLQSYSGSQTDTEWLCQKIYQRIGDIWGIRDWESRQKALGLFDKAIYIVSKRKKSSVYKKELMGIYIRKGDVYMKMGGEKNREKAWRFYKKAELIGEELKDEPLLEENICNWLICCDRVDFAQVLMERELSEDWKGRYEDNRKILEQLEKNWGTSFIKQVHVACLEHEGSLWMKKKLSEIAFSIAEKKLQDAKKILEELIESDRDISYQRDLCVIYSRLGDLFVQYMDMIPNRETAAQKALEYYKEAYDYAKELRKCSGTVENRIDYMVMSRKLGEWYRVMDKEDYNKIQKYYTQSLEEAINLEKELLTPESMMDVSLLCSRIADISINISDGVHLRKRMELFERKAKDMMGDIFYKDCNLELHCGYIHLEDK